MSNPNGYGYIMRNGSMIGNVPAEINSYSTAPIGCIFPYAGTNIPKGYLLCNGQEVSRTLYSSLYNVIGTIYGEGNGSTTFNIPNLIDKFIQGSEIAGEEKEAGLPNITGEFGISETKSFYGSSPASGAFKVGSSVGNVEGYSSSGTYAGYRMSIDASRSSSIYGSSDTVQPPALTMVYIIKAYPVDGSCYESDNSAFAQYIDEQISKSSTKNIKINTTRMIAHRGKSDTAPENTIPAYELAADYGYWGGEVDIQKTSDGHFVCLHDRTVNRTTNGTGNVSSLTLSEIKSLHIIKQNPFMGSAENGTLSYGEASIKVPTLEEYLDACKRYNIVPIIELKEETLRESDMPAILDIIDKWGMVEQVVFIAFNEKNTNLLEKIHSINSKIMCQALIDFTKKNIDYVADNLSPNCGIDSEYTQITKELVEYAHSRGVEVNCWTCDDEDAKELLISYGVDYITTNKLINSNLTEMENGALRYELGGFNRTVDALQKVFEINSELYPNIIYCQNPVLGNHNVWDPQNTEEMNNGTTPYERVILTSSLTQANTSIFTKRAIDKTKYYVNQSTVYISGLDFTKYKVTLLPFNEKGLFITDLGWITSWSPVALPENTQFVLFYFARVDDENITNTDLENMKSTYFCKTQRRRYVKLDDDFSFISGLNAIASQDNPLPLHEILSGKIVSDSTSSVFCLKGLNVKGYTTVKAHHLTDDYKVTIYPFTKELPGRLICRGNIGWLEDGVEKTLSNDPERAYFLISKKDSSTITVKDLISISNNFIIELC